METSVGSDSGVIGLYCPASLSSVAERRRVSSGSHHRRCRSSRTSREPPPPCAPVDRPRSTPSGPPTASMTSRSRRARRPSSPRRWTPPSTWVACSLTIPILASAMDAVVDVRLAGELARLGGAAVLNLEGVQARFDDPDAVLAHDRRRRAGGPVPALLAEAYSKPIREDLVALRLEQLHAAGSPAIVAATPGAARKWGPFCAEHGADLFLVQSQVSSARHLATGYDPLELSEFTRLMPIPVAVGNTTSYDAAYQLMGQGIAAIFVGVGPGRRVHHARGARHRRAAGDRHQRRGRRARRVLRRHRPLRAGRRGRRHAPRRRAGQGDRCGRGRADARVAAGPRGRRLPAAARTGGWPRRRPRCRAARASRSARSARSSGSCSARRRSRTARENLVGALRQSMAALGARDIRAMQQVEMVYAPSVAVEGKSWQRGR